MQLTHEINYVEYLQNEEQSFQTHNQLLQSAVALLTKRYVIEYEGRSESKDRFAIQRYLLITGKKQNMQVLSHTFAYFSTKSPWTMRHLYRDTSLLTPSSYQTAAWLFNQSTTGTANVR